MPNPRLTQVIAALPFEKKIVGVGTLLMIIGLFFPWYQDFDAFRGDTFSGLNGPLYLVGFSFLVIAGLSLAVMVMDHLDRPMPFLKIKSSRLHFWGGIVSFYLLLLEGSVYFHPAFGVNITLKQSGFGMFMAYAAAALLTVGGYMEGRGKSAVKEFEKETRDEIEEVVKTNAERTARPVAEAQQQQVKPRESLRAPYSGSTGSGMRHPSQEQQPEKVTSASAADAQEEETPTQPYRMDL